MHKVACDVCGKKVMNMKAHVKRMHGGGRPGCTVTVVLSGLGQHVLDNHSESERSISPPPHLSDEDIQQSISDYPQHKKKKNDLDLPPFTSNQLSPQIFCRSGSINPASSRTDEELNSPVLKLFLRTKSRLKPEL